MAALEKQGAVQAYSSCDGHIRRKEEEEVARTFGTTANGSVADAGAADPAAAGVLFPSSRPWVSIGVEESDGAEAPTLL